MLAGNIVTLRTLEPEDLPQLLIWRNNAAIRRYYREYRELTMYDQEVWYKAVCCGNRNFCMFGITYAPKTEDTTALRPDTGQLIGVCGLTNINWVLRSAELSFYIGWRDLYCEDEYAMDAVNILFQYTFDVLNMHKIWAEIYDFDEQKKKACPALGMRLDSVLRDTAFDGGRYYNSLIYSLLEDEYRKL